MEDFSHLSFYTQYPYHAMRAHFYQGIGWWCNYHKKRPVMLFWNPVYTCGLILGAVNTVYVNKSQTELLYNPPSQTCLPFPSVSCLFHPRKQSTFPPNPLFGMDSAYTALFIILDTSRNNFPSRKLNPLRSVSWISEISWNVTSGCSLT